jgi:hypothetical protein
MTEVIQYQATDITASDYETFDECAERILKATRRRLRYKDPDNPANLDGIPIEIDPKLYQVFLMLSLTRLGTPEEFKILFDAIMAVVKQLEEAEKLPKDWVKFVATPFNTKCPKIPEHFADSIAGEIVKAYLTGTAEITLAREIPPLAEEPEVE